MRRAFRIDDNTSLMRALNDAEEVIPLVCLSRDARYHSDSPRRNFVRGVLAGLDGDLRGKGSALHVRRGNPEDQIVRAAVAYGADVVYAARIYDPVQLQRDARIRRSLESAGKHFITLQDHLLFDPGDVVKSTGDPFKVFTPFKRAWLLAGDDVPRPARAPLRIPPVPCADGSCTLDRVKGFGVPGLGLGEKAARKRLNKFVSSSLALYHIRRDVPAIDGTSRLSPYLSLGALSIRRVYWKIREAGDLHRTSERQGVNTFLSELIWREFYYNILGSFPHVVDHPFRPEFADVQWYSNLRHFTAWKDGLTGYPIVDAGMRQLNAEGWMHNRARMIVASFLTKDLHLNWQWGEKHFAGQLIDADLASNNGGWQWSAGTGTDASPWFRIFNPVLQGKKFDPEGVYVKRYVPELSRVPAARIHEPWTLSPADQQALGCIIGKTYPGPIVRHDEERKMTFALYSHSR